MISHLRSVLRSLLALFCLAIVPFQALAQNYSDIWWNPNESGWGLTLADHNSQLFGVWFTYREDGRPTWYVIPGGTFSNNRQQFRGDIYATTGPAYSSARFDPSRVTARVVGTATIDFAPQGLAAGTALFGYSVGGITQTKQIQRQPFGNASPAWGSDVTDIWWNPSESGWGLTLAQHGNNVFGVWFTYDTDSQPLWVVMPGVTFNGASSFTGTLYTTTGPYFGITPFDSTKVVVTQQGSASVSVANGASSSNAQCSDGKSATFDPVFRGNATRRTTCPQAFGDRPTSDAPTPMAAPPGTPDAQAAAFASAIAAAADTRGRLAAWLGLYQALGIPVINEAGVSLTGTGDDPAGPPYWVIWYGAGMNQPKRGMTLSEAGRVLTIQGDGTSDAGAGAALLADLRAAAGSADSRTRLFGAFVRERILKGRSQLDLMQGTPEDLVVDTTTVQLLHWALLRGTMYSFAKAQVKSLGATDAKAGKTRCAEMFGSEDATTWVNGIFSKLYQGLELPFGKSLPGLIEITVKQLGTVSETVERRSKNAFAAANAVGLLTSLVMQVESLRVEAIMDGGALVRSKTTANGETKVVDWHLYYDSSLLPDGNDMKTCIATWALSTFGFTFNFPPKEDVAGSEVTFKPGHNIPEKVLFNTSQPNYRITTNASGMATQNFIGKGQKQDLPSSAKAYDDTFSVIVSAQPEEVKGSSIANMFIDSFAFATNPTLGGIFAPVVNTLKTLHYELGETVLDMKDWSAAGYEVDWVQAGTRVWGTICNGLDRSFSLNFDTGGTITGTLAFSPSSASGGTVRLLGQATGGLINYSGGGTYTVGSGPSIVMSIPQQTATIPVTGQVITVPGPSGTLPLLATNKCPL